MIISINKPEKKINPIGYYELNKIDNNLIDFIENHRKDIPFKIEINKCSILTFSKPLDLASSIDLFKIFFTLGYTFFIVYHNTLHAIT